MAASILRMSSKVLTTISTGCKCLCHSALPKCQGRVLHDSHAETLALRGLNHFLLSELSQMLLREEVYESAFIEGPDSVAASDRLSPDEPDSPPFAIRQNISIHMFSSEPPCGDASMNILMNELGPEASQPWTYELSQRPGKSVLLNCLHGRAFFSSLGILRRKPSRPDAEPTLSKSCTDKLSLKQITSLLSFPANHLIASTRSAYLSSLVIPGDKYDETGYTRAFSQSGRLLPLMTLQLPNGCAFQAFQSVPLPPDFEPKFPFSKPINPVRDCSGLSPKPDQKSKQEHKTKPSNLSALYILDLQSHCSSPSSQSTSTNETLLNGVKQGFTIISPNPKRPA